LPGCWETCSQAGQEGFRCEASSRAQPSGARETDERRRAFQRDQHPQDLVGTVIFLASADSDFITGQTINVAGGANLY